MVKQKQIVSFLQENQHDVKEDIITIRLYRVPAYLVRVRAASGYSLS